MNALTAKGMQFWDYGNSFLLEASRAGADILEKNLQASTEAASKQETRFRYPTYVQDIMGDIFSLGFGPFRWVCTSGLASDLSTTDEIALGVLSDIRDRLSNDSSGSDYAMRAVPQFDDNILWIREAEGHNLVVGSQARILYANAEARSKMALAFNEAVKQGQIEGALVIGRPRVRLRQDYFNGYRIISQDPHQFPSAARSSSSPFIFPVPSPCDQVR